MQEVINKEVCGFTSRFTLNGKFDQVVTAFTCGCCYWFALILYTRFEQYQPTVVYDEVANHFATKIGNRVFDISGDVTDQFNWVDFADMEDDLLRNRLIRDCIMFER